MRNLHRANLIDVTCIDDHLADKLGVFEKRKLTVEPSKSDHNSFFHDSKEEARRIFKDAEATDLITIRPL